MNTIILAGGTGTMGRILQEHIVRQGNRVVVLTRDPGHHHRPGVAFLPWDGRTLGPWASELEGARAVINLAGRSVDSRYTARNRALICAVGWMPPACWAKRCGNAPYHLRYGST
jgi:NAD dependent epimerase/dehydratase family enzyme